MPVIGYLDPQSLDGTADRLRAFRQGLKDTGYVEAECNPEHRNCALREPNFRAWLSTLGQHSRRTGSRAGVARGVGRQE
jgi:hypothetical protein